MRKMEAIQVSQQRFEQDRAKAAKPIKKSEKMLQNKRKRDGEKAVLPLQERTKQILEKKEMKL